MDTDFVYWKHSTPVGIRVEEVSGGDDYNKKVWQEIALQIFCEHGPDSYREILHFQSGAPVIKGYDARISITHTPGLLAVAFLTPTPDVDLSIFNPRTAMGIDAERLDREKVINVRDKFLNDEEKGIIPSSDITLNVLAWTAKEAVLKTGMNPAIDFKNDIIIHSLPEIDPTPGITKNPRLGSATLILRNGQDMEEYPMDLYAYESEGFCVCIAFSPKSARYEKRKNN